MSEEKNEWKNSLFGCLEDDQFLTMTCCASFMWPQAQLMYQMRVLDNNRELGVEDFLLTCCCFPCMHFIKRREIQSKFDFHNKDKNLPIDILAVCCLTQCAMHQQTMELKARDLKPAGLFMEA